MNSKEKQAAHAYKSSTRKVSEIESKSKRKGYKQGIEDEKRKNENKARKIKKENTRESKGKAKNRHWMWARESGRPCTTYL